MSIPSVNHSSKPNQVAHGSSSSVPTFKHPSEFVSIIRGSQSSGAQRVFSRNASPMDDPEVTKVQVKIFMPIPVSNTAQLPRSQSTPSLAESPFNGISLTPSDLSFVLCVEANGSNNGTDKGK